MDESPSKGWLAEMLCCCSLLEDFVAKAYRRIALLVADRDVKLLLRYLANDSLKHARTLSDMSKRLSAKVNVNPEKCSKLMGEAWMNAFKDAERWLSRKEKVGAEELLALIASMEAIEKLAGEEYLMVINAKLLESLLEEHGLKFKHYKAILEWIAEDEKRHEAIMKAVREIISRQP
ncbi:MAG: hypothetical protein QFX33_00505 [Candidatus Nezhaarchaeota archaeon]|nr:hypothetical protein [Candidatus Nezhaarchaeota archaeon]